MKLALVGGGGFRTPTIYRALLDRVDDIRFDDVVLVDRDASRLDRIGRVLEGLAREQGRRVRYRTTTSLDDALEGAHFVYCAVRVGGLEGRIVDETVPLGHGVLGQETTGPGGLGFALRTVPVVTRIAEAVAERAPDAWFINFTNPAGLVTEAAQRILGTRAIGICDGPPELCRRVAHALGRPPEALGFDYFGLNHLGWLRGVYDRGRDRLPELLADDERLRSMEEGRLFGAEWLRLLGVLPNEYLYYYYSNREAVASMQSAETRAQYLEATQRRFYAGADDSPEAVTAAWRATIAERERTYMANVGTNGRADEPADGNGDGAGPGGGEEPGGYGAVALQIVSAIADNRPTLLILDTRNRSSLPFLDEDAVVEVPCVVSGAGVAPLASGDAPLHAKGLVQIIKEVERTTIDAALSGSRALALRALALHPLVPSVETARRILGGYLERHPGLAEQLR
jgi:6-phospho-beta-glucosidase